MIKFQIKANGQSINFGHGGVQINGTQYRMKDNGDGTVTMEQVDVEVDEQDGVWSDTPKKELSE